MQGDSIKKYFSFVFKLSLNCLCIFCFTVGCLFGVLFVGDVGACRERSCNSVVYLVTRCCT